MKSRMPKIHSIIGLIAAVSMSALVSIAPAGGTNTDSDSERAAKPRLIYLLSQPDNLERLSADLGFSPAQTDRVKKALRRQSDDLLTLARELESKVDPNDSTLIKKLAVIGTDYNRRVLELESVSWRELQAVAAERSDELDRWIEEEWSREVERHGVEGFAVAATSAGNQVFATQYAGHSGYEVAIPDKYIKFANHPDFQYISRPPGYEGNNYQVRLRYGGKDITVKVLDVGPWNIDDNYWNAPDAPVRPRRLFTDLPQGMPQAQAAFYDNHNGGKDQFGRLVLNPAGIDLTPAVAADLGLRYLENAWIDVSFTWERPLTEVKTPPYSTGKSKTKNFQVSWSTPYNAAETIAFYQVQRRIGSDGTWANWQSQTTGKSATFAGEAGKTYYFRARATDKEGNRSPWSTVKHTIVPHDNNSLIAVRSGFTGTIKQPSSGFYLGTVRHSSKAGHKITYRFTGRSVAVIGTKGPGYSKAKIYIDGKYIKTIDAYASTVKYRQSLYSKSWTKSGTHTITIENLATSGRSRLDMDGLAVRDDKSRPLVRLAAPSVSTNVSKGKTFKVSWQGSPAGSSIASYRVQRKIGAGGTWVDWKSKTTDKSAIFPGKIGKTYYFRVRANDQAGNLSAWSTVKTTIVPHDNDTLIVERNGFGGVISKASSSYYLGTVRYATKRDAGITYELTGRSVALIGTKAPDRGRAHIYIDGEYVETVDAYASSIRYRRILYSRTWNESGKHTLRVVNEGTPDRRRFDVDGIAVRR
jgi:hypothetical protein